ncbi:acetyl-CoA carboxylase biotin carboxyl carrier protein subunit, partial [Thermococcus sp.]
MAKVKVIVDGVTYEVEVEELGSGKFKVSFEGESYEVKAQDFGISVGTTEIPAQTQVPVSAPVSAPAPARVASAVPAGEGVVVSPMPGKILRILVREGEEVKTG